MDDLEDELEKEQGFRAKAVKKCMDLTGKLEELQDHLEEAEAAKFAQLEIYKNRETEIFKMKRDLEEVAIQQVKNFNSIFKGCFKSK